MEKIKSNKFYWPKFDLFKRDSAFVSLWDRTGPKLA